MKRKSFYIFIATILFFNSCNSSDRDLIYDNPDLRIIFLHHSTGNLVWDGDLHNNKVKSSMSQVPRMLKEYNQYKGLKISIEERIFPKGKPYPWKNYPYDYYNIWVKNGGSEPFMEEPTLEMLTKDYNIIIFKHCFPVSGILEDDVQADINSEKKTLANYKLQYNALKEKLHQFPGVKFLVWTGAALVESQTTKEQALRAHELTEWVKSEWDEKDDNIEIFDFRNIETEGGLYLKPEYATNSSDSHPNSLLCEKAARLFVARIIALIEK